MISIYEDFVKDYNNPNITGEDVKRLNGLNARQYSHFEENPTQTDVSWYRYPNDLKNLTKEKANVQEKHFWLCSV